MKAFLSHSSTDKEFVAKVAKSLGREYIVYDSYSFDHAEEFRAEIIRGLGKSNVFVFFCSKEALKRYWVNFELEEAQQRTFQKEISKAIAINIEPDIPIDSLPLWLRKANIPFIDSPQVAARLIREHVNDLKRRSAPDLLIGRANDIERVERAMAPPSESRPAGIVALWGLPGIGRRSVAKRVMRDILDFQRAIYVSVEAGDNATDLRVKLASLLDGPRTVPEYKELQKQAESVGTSANIRECIRYFEQAQEARELIIIVDQGGLLDDEGAYHPDFEELLRAIFTEELLRTILVSRRRPAPISFEGGISLPAVRIDRLSDSSTRILLQQLQAQDRISLSSREIEPIVDRIKGYPPAAYHAIGLIKDYGKELVIRDGGRIIAYREAAFIRVLQTEAKFSQEQRSILEILPHFDALPLPVLGSIVGASQDVIDRESMKLVDMALLSIDDVGFYCVSDPLRDVAYKLFSNLSGKFDKIADAIDNYINERYENGDEDGAPLILLRAKYKAYVLAGRDRSKLFHIASDLTRLQETFYHEQEYEKSIEFGKQALDIRRNQPDALKYLARALTQLERYREAFECIDQIRALSPKEAKFLEGFLFRKQGQTAKAVSAYREALALGHRGVAIHRELGQCLFEERKFKEAREHLEITRNADPENKFVLDYDIQVAIAEEDFERASDSLRLLEQVEDTVRVEHRRSTLEYARGNYQAAFTAAKAAVDSSERPHFEVITQYVKSAIKVNQAQDAQKGLTMLSTRFQGIRMDIQNGLRARYYVAQGDASQAMSFWDRITRKNTVVHKRIRQDILNLLIQRDRLSSVEKLQYQMELEELRKQPNNAGIDALEQDLT